MGKDTHCHLSNLGQTWKRQPLNGQVLLITSVSKVTAFLEAAIVLTYISTCIFLPMSITGMAVLNQITKLIEKSPPPPPQRYSLYKQRVKIQYKSKCSMYWLLQICHWHDSLNRIQWISKDLHQEELILVLPQLTDDTVQWCLEKGEATLGKSFFVPDLHAWALRQPASRAGTTSALYFNCHIQKEETRGYREKRYYKKWECGRGIRAAISIAVFISDGY